MSEEPWAGCIGFKLAMSNKEGGGKDDGATVNGLLIFIEGISLVIAEK